jgi:hypothetical protein
MSEVIELHGVVPNQKFLDGETPKIEWAGKDWPIPLLAPKQNRHVLPAIMRVRHKVRTINVATAEPISEDDFEDLSKIVYWGLKRAHPDLTRDDFDEVSMPMKEMLKAMTVVAKQASGVPDKDEGDGNSAEVGEDKSLRTGT